MVYHISVYAAGSSRRRTRTAKAQRTVARGAGCAAQTRRERDHRSGTRRARGTLGTAAAAAAGCTTRRTARTCDRAATSTAARTAAAARHILASARSRILPPHRACPATFAPRDGAAAARWQRELLVVAANARLRKVPSQRRATCTTTRVRQLDGRPIGRRRERRLARRRSGGSNSSPRRRPDASN